ncbi:putative chloramphenicol acetyltransferase-like domain superfamily [Helianthus anomalus]
MVFFLIDTPDSDGIEAWVLLDKERMEIFENDMELLSFCKVIYILLYFCLCKKRVLYF